VTTKRRYDDPCGVARALDVVGERWALLIVRELLLGPKRFGHLRRDLPGISPNVLSQRLDELVSAGLVRRAQLDPPAGLAVYELTDRGHALEAALIELGRWGSRERIVSRNELTADAFLLALRAAFIGAMVNATFALRVDGGWYTVVVRRFDIETRRGRPERPVATLEGDTATVRAFAFGRTSLADAEAGGLIVGGSRATARRLPRFFRVPPPG
jgi:DNA-binding HxlR family transcriptional regulator